MLFQLFQLFSSEPNGKQLLNVSSYLDILIPVVAQYEPSEAPELTFTSDSLCRYRCIATARYSTCGEGILGNSWHLAEPRWSL